MPSFFNALFGTQTGGKRRGVVSMAALLAITTLAWSEPASAQLFFDWGGEEQKPNDTGRKVVKFNSDAKVGEIIVSFADRRLYHVIQPGLAVSYPVAAPREQDRWEGKTTVTQKRENPSWTPTPSMLKENPKLPRWVPGGHPMNPLGVRALYLGSSLYRIHGTDAPWTIGTAVSKGCIRMYNKDAQDLYEQVKVGAKVLVTWKAFDSSAASEQQAAAAESAAPSAPAKNVDEPRRKSRGDSQAEVLEPVKPMPSKSAAPAARSKEAVAEPAQPEVAPRKSAEKGTTEPRAKKQRIEASSTTETPPRHTASTNVHPATEATVRPAAVTPKDVKESTAKETAPSALDIAQRALQAAERAAAAAERAAAAAERAEQASKVATAKSSEQTPAAEARTPAPAPAPVETKAAETPAAAAATGETSN